MIPPPPPGPSLEEANDALMQGRNEALLDAHLALTELSINLVWQRIEDVELAGILRQHKAYRLARMHLGKAKKRRLWGHLRVAAAYLHTWYKRVHRVEELIAERREVLRTVRQIQQAVVALEKASRHQ